MCIIILNQKGIAVEDEILHESLVANPHGIGVYFSDTGSVSRFYGKNLKMIRPVFYNKKFIAHFRLSSVGSVNKKNIHPFAIDRRYYIFHNGTLPFKDKKDATISDTRIFSRLLTDFVKKGFDIMSTDFKNLFETMDRRNKVVIVDRQTNKYVIFNEHLGKWIKDVWYSKDPFPRARVINTTMNNYSYNYANENDEGWDSWDRDINKELDNRKFMDYIHDRNTI